MKLRHSDRQKLKERKNWPLFKKNCSRKSRSQETPKSFLTVDNLLQYVKKIEVDRRKITYTEFVFNEKGEQTMKEKIYDARTGMEYVLVGDYYLPALKLPRTRPVGRWGMLHKAYLKLRKTSLLSEPAAEWKTGY